MTCDPYWNNVSLLISGDGTNGGTTFTDESPVGWTVAPTGVTNSNTEQQFGLNTAYFNGSLDYLAIATAAGDPLDLTAGDFTVEGWIWAPNVTIGPGGSFQIIFSTYNPYTASSPGVRLYINAGILTMQTFGASSATVSAPNTMTASAWHYFACVRSGPNIAVYLDGVGAINNGQTALGTYTGNQFSIGCEPLLSAIQGTQFGGYMSQFRVTKGVSRYNSPFIPPTAPPPVVVCPATTCDADYSDTVLLLQMAGSSGSTVFNDTSLVANPIIVTGTTDVNTSGPLPGVQSANIPPNGNSFSAITCLSAAITTGAPLDILSGSADFTIEGWFFIPVLSVNHITLFDYGDTQAAGGNAGGLYIETNQSPPTFSVHSSTLGWGAGGTGVAPMTEVWHHFAVERIAGQGYLYLDGYLQNSGQIPFTNWTGYAGVPANSLAMFGDSSAASNNAETAGLQIADIRVTAGVGRYTGNTYEIPTSGFVAGGCSGIVPNVVGLSDAAAASALMSAGFTVGSVTTAANVAAPGVVLSQNPVAGTAASTPSAVDLVESTGVEVPDLTNLSTGVASAELALIPLVLGVQTPMPSVLIIPGNIIDQSIAPGTFVAGGTAINVDVSTGRASLLVPLILFLTEGEAVTALESVGLLPGAISFAPSSTFASGEIMAQNPSAGSPTASGALVSFVVSTGQPVASTAFDFESTVISQYANSPTLLALVSNMNDYIDQSVNFAAFYQLVWNVDTAVGFGLDIWGKIVNVSRLLTIPNTTLYVGFDNSATPPPDWQTMGSNQPPQPAVGGAMYTGHNATQSYLLDDDAYRQLILAKAFANICETTAPAINRILQNLYGAGNAWVLNAGVMAITYNFNFDPSPVQLAILEQSGVIPTPPGVSVTIVTP